MKENVDRELPVVTGLGTFIGPDISCMARLDTPLGRGIQFGVGRGKKPISNFPGEQVGFRPLWGDERMPKISADELLVSLPKDVNERIARVTVKVGHATDQRALLDIVQGIREKLSGAEIVVSSHYISMLEKVRDGDIKPDVLQQLVDQPIEMSASGNVADSLKWGQIFKGAEVVVSHFPYDCLPSPNVIEEVSQLLADHGQDSYIDLVDTQQQVEACLAASSMFNFGQRCRAEHGKSGIKRPEVKHKLRGFYVKGVPHGLRLNGSNANFASMGEGLWADKGEERATK